MTKTNEKRLEAAINAEARELLAAVNLRREATGIWTRLLAMQKAVATRYGEASLASTYIASAVGSLEHALRNMET